MHDLHPFPFPASFTDSSDMKTFEKLTIGRTRDRDSGSVFSDFEFRRCEFDDCEISLGSRPELRSTLRNCQLQRCIVRQNCSINTAVVEDCVVDGLETRGPVFVRGALFKHVVLKGNVGRLILTAPLGLGPGFGEVSPFVSANAEYYRGVDWALDLTQCEAKELQLSGVPGRLIRRDPTTQVLVTRERALAVDWQSLPLGGSPYAVVLNHLTRYGDDARVLIAPHRDRSFLACIQAQKVLRDAGVAEPD
jgi:hypothetical protein